MHFWHLLTQVSGGDGVFCCCFLPSLVIGDGLVIFVDVFSCSLQVLSSSKTVFLWGIMYCCIRISSARATLICKSFSAVFFIQCILYLVRKLQKLNNWKNKKEKKKRGQGHWVNLKVLGRMLTTASWNSGKYVLVFPACFWILCCVHWGCVTVVVCLWSLFSRIQPACSYRTVCLEAVSL